ncbi:MAG TPA: hypothetical protein PKI61_00480 [bacterium]|nr:hypothetical protein [bacterium]HPT29515.1 hypothetical protein [bacterium]
MNDKNNFENLNNQPSPESAEKTPEQLLEKLEPLLDGLSQVEEAIEDRGLEYIDNQPDKKSKSAVKMQQIIETLQKESLVLLKKISKELASYPRAVADTFRDNYINNSAARKNRKFSKNDFSNQEKSSTNQTDEEASADWIKSNKIFEANLREAKGLITMMNSQNWGNSAKADAAFLSSQRLLETLINQANFLYRNAEISRLLEILEKNSTTVLSPISHLDKIIETQCTHFTVAGGIPSYYNIEYDNPTDQKIKEVFSDDPFLILNYLKNAPDSVRNLRSGLLLGQLDVLMEKYPSPGVWPVFIGQAFKRAININPEKYLNDPDKRAYLFSVFKNSFAKGETREFGDLYRFYDEFQGVDKQEREELIDRMRHTNEEDIKLSMLPLTPAEIKKLAPENPGLQFFFHKELGLTADERLVILQEQIQKTTTSRAYCFLVRLASSFSDCLAGLDSAKVEESLNKLIAITSRGSQLEDLQELLILFEKNNIPAQYRDSLISAYAGNFNNPGVLLDVMNKNIDASGAARWVQKQPGLADKLEPAFYRTAKFDDLRHFFFQVLDGRPAADMDLLTKTYAEQIAFLPAQDFIDLFLVSKKIDKRYAPLFILKTSSLRDQLTEALNVGSITQDDYDWTAQEFFKLGSAETANKFLNDCFAPGKMSPESRLEALESYGVSRAHRDPSILEAINSNFLKFEEKKVLAASFFNEFVKYKENYLYILQDIRAFRTFEIFFTPEERKEYFKKIVADPEPAVIIRLLLDYFNDAQRERIITANIAPEDWQQFFAAALNTEDLGVEEIFLANINSLSAGERELFSKRITSRDNILVPRGAKEDNSSSSAFLSRLLNNLQEDASDQDNSQSLSRELLAKIFSGPNLSASVLNSLIDRSDKLKIAGQDVFDEYIDQCAQADGGVYTLRILDHLGRLDLDILSAEQIKTLSYKFLREKGMSFEVYGLYFNSDPERPIFYLDQAGMDLALQKAVIGDGNDQIKFLRLQREARGRGLVACSPEQEQQTILGIMSYNSSWVSARELFDFDNEMFLNGARELITRNKASRELVKSILTSGIEISGSLAPEIIAHSFGDRLEFFLPYLCQAYGQDPKLREQIKDQVKGVEGSDAKTRLNTILLQEDFLSPAELKALYDEVRERKSPREQVLANAEIFGSFVTANKMEEISAFIEGEDREAEAAVKNISEFVARYPLQSKGRTIAVMLFAREYLPELGVGEIIKRVGRSLNKYEKILADFEYNNIPAGLQASIGMEYEITDSTASGYKELTEGNLATDISRLSAAAHIGSGNDAVHEIATRPATNPYLLLLEMKLLNDIEYVDFNFDRSPLYQKGSRGYHLTIGGESGLNVNANTFFIQNALLAASWGGVHAGELGKKTSGGRGVTLRQRDASQTHNVKIFEKTTPSVELRSLSIDKMESFQRSVLSAYNSAIAIQALEKYTALSSYQLPEVFGESKNAEEFFLKLSEEVHGLMPETFGESKAKIETASAEVKEIIYSWAKLVTDVQKAVEYHNNEFLSGETYGYLDKEIWVDTQSFGGEYNQKRFEEVVSSIDPTLSVEEYTNTTKIKFNDLFASFSKELADSFTKINNLYLKPTTKSREQGKDGTKEQNIFAGDQANAIAMLRTTKMNNETLEGRNDRVYLEGTIFDTVGDKRQGYYYIQGASEKMLTHAVQIALLEFNRSMEKILHKRAA